MSLQTNPLSSMIIIIFQVILFQKPRLFHFHFSILYFCDSITMGSLKVMMVAEKPSIASSIAKILSNGQYQERKGKLPVYIYSGTFKGQPADFYVSLLLLQAI